MLTTWSFWASLFSHRNKYSQSPLPVNSLDQIALGPRRDEGAGKVERMALGQLGLGAGFKCFQR